MRYLYNKKKEERKGGIEIWEKLRKERKKRSRPATNVKSWEVITGTFGIKDILVHHEGGASRVVLAAEPNLPDGPVLPKDIVHLVAADFKGEVPADHAATSSHK